MGGKHHALAPLPPGSYEGHMEERMKQRAENVCWLRLSVLETLKACISAAYSNMLHTKVKYNQ